MARQFLGVTPRRWLEYLVAILLGNAIYYFSLVPYLPDSLRHQGFSTDGGVLVDFVVCVLVYGLIRLGVRVRRGSAWKRRRNRVRGFLGSGSKGQDYFFRGLDGLPAQPRRELLPPTNQSFRCRNKLITSPYRHKALDFPLLADGGP